MEEIQSRGLPTPFKKWETDFIKRGNWIKLIYKSIIPQNIDQTLC